MLAVFACRSARGWPLASWPSWSCAWPAMCWYSAVPGSPPKNAARVQEELEPLAHRARTRRRCHRAFDRTVLTYLKPGSRQDHAAIEGARLPLQDAVAEHLKHLRPQLNVDPRDDAIQACSMSIKARGVELMEQFDRARELRRFLLVAHGWPAPERIASAGAMACGGRERDGAALARRAWPGARCGSRQAHRTIGAAELLAVRRGAPSSEVAFRSKLMEHGDEFKRSPGHRLVRPGPG